MVLSANPRSLCKYSANLGTADSNGTRPRRRLRVTRLLACQLQHLSHATVSIDRMLAHPNCCLCLGSMLLQALRHEPLLYVRLARSNICNPFFCANSAK